MRCGQPHLAFHTVISILSTENTLDACRSTESSARDFLTRYFAVHKSLFMTSLNIIQKGSISLSRRNTASLLPISRQPTSRDTSLLFQPKKLLDTSSSSERPARALPGYQDPSRTSTSPSLIRRTQVTYKTRLCLRLRPARLSPDIL